ncbi:MAG: CoA pyrophosphatase [Deltaproteobacteria bacterium]|jgi:8-oxo-dGTP pyrophosphatase MutT (NUDIX family)|nr:CoA pyrophosphatase [Deltaproteobacteria bacterium]
MNLKVTKELPGAPANIEMAPPYLVPALTAETPDTARRAAVMAVLTPVNAGGTKQELLDWEVLLTQRHCYNGAHSGQVSFPGGKRDRKDADFWATASRETFEEVGLAGDRLQKVAELTRIFIPLTNFAIHPFLALRLDNAPILPNPREVAGYHNFPLRLFDPGLARMMDFDCSDGINRPAPVWLYEGYSIWGATAMVLSEIFRLADGDGFAVF